MWCVRCIASSIPELPFNTRQTPSNKNLGGSRFMKPYVLGSWGSGGFAIQVLPLRRYQAYTILRSTLNGCSCNLAVLFVGVLAKSVLLFGVYMKAPDFSKPPKSVLQQPVNPRAHVFVVAASALYPKVWRLCVA